MLSKIRSTTIFGIDALWVDVETEIVSGKRKLTLVGLPDGIVRESKDRVRCAIESSGFPLPNAEVVVSLAPASLPKAGSGFDLAIALSILAAANHLDKSKLSDVIAVGELALDGKLKTTAGVLATACALRGCSRLRLLVPAINSREATLLDSTGVYPIISLRQAVSFLNGQIVIEEVKPSSTVNPPMTTEELSLTDVVGQHVVKRALEVAAAGGHNALMIGPPGCGKSMLARRLPGLLPPLSYDEAIEVTKIARASAFSSGLKNCELMWQRPLRSPHHTTSCVGLIGGGSIPRPGEISLAHRGILFLDELPEFRRDSLEALRQPLEDRRVTISRAATRLTFPADFQLITAMNPCPCGKKGSTGCNCSVIAIEKYRSRISGPLLDRIDLQLWVAPVALADLTLKREPDRSEEIKNRVVLARQRQLKRSEPLPRINAQLSEGEMRTYCNLSRSGMELIENAGKRHNLSARAFNRIIKVARTIADLRGAENIEVTDLSEAISYRIGLSQETR